MPFDTDKCAAHWRGSFPDASDAEISLLVQGDRALDAIEALQTVIHGTSKRPPVLERLTCLCEDLEALVLKHDAGTSRRA
jgi:hypothetical protein